MTNIDHEWRTGSLIFSIPDNFKAFEYERRPAPKEDIKRWREMGFTHENFTGKMFGEDNVMPSWIYKIADELNLENCGFCFYKMETGDIMPDHTDHYSTYKQVFKIDKEVSIWRAIVFLEDWSPGHYFEIDKQPIVDWKAGDYVIWKDDVPHMAANLGQDDRYTLQITGILSETQFEQALYWKNIPGKKDHLGFMRKDIAKSTLDNETKPFFVYTGTNHIRELEKYKFDNSIIPRLNNTGIDIYLFEPLSSYFYKDKEKAYNAGFYAEGENFSGADELDSIDILIKRNKLSNVTVYCCDYRVKFQFQKKYPKMKLQCFDIFVQTRTENELSETKEPPFNYRFLCPNWRYTLHRHIIASFLANYNEDTLLSWYFKSRWDLLKKNNWFDFDRLEKESPEKLKQLKNGFTILNQQGPFVIDKDARATAVLSNTAHNYYPGTAEAFMELGSHQLGKYFQQAFCVVANETRFAQYTANFSEKTIEPMLFLKPVVTVAPPKTLEYMKELGFKTFDKWWSEEYDQEEDHYKRMIKILELLEYIYNLTESEITDMYNDMKDVLFHNQRNYRKLAKRRIILD